jgi:hypothetical protein
MNYISENMDFIKGLDSLDYIIVENNKLSHDNRYFLSVRSYWPNSTHTHIANCINNTFINFLDDTNSKNYKEKSVSINECLENLDKIKHLFDTDLINHIIKDTRKKINDIDIKLNANLKRITRITNDKDVHISLISQLIPDTESESVYNDSEPESEPKSDSEPEPEPESESESESETKPETKSGAKQEYNLFDDLCNSFVDVVDIICDLVYYINNQLHKLCSI